MVSIAKGMMMSVGSRALRPSRSPDFLGIPSHYGSLVRALQKHLLQRVCAPDVEFVVGVDKVSDQGHDADEAPLCPIFPHNTLHCLRVSVGTVGDAGGGSYDEQKGQSATDEIANPEKRLV